MDFQKLMQTMRDLDQPATAESAAVKECGDPMMAGMNTMPPSMNDQQPPPAHPSLSVNLNAQGMDNIEQIMRLITKVNPEMINQKSPLNAMPHAAEIEPAGDAGMSMLTPPGPGISSIGDLGNLDAGPLKMLPDLGPEPTAHAEPDGDEGGIEIDIDGGDEGEEGGEEKGENPFGDNSDDEGEDTMSVAQGDVDNDGDHDHADHEAEKETDSDDSEEEETDEAWANEPDEKFKSVDYMNNQLAGGMNRPKATFPKVAGGDNPMQKNESGDLRSQIRAELMQRLAEAKGAK